MLRNKNQAEANAIKPEIGDKIVTISRPAVSGPAKPAPATNYTVRTTFRSCGIGHSAFRFTLLIIGFTIPVAAPLPYIAVHIVQPPRIRRKTVNRNGVLPFFGERVTFTVCLVGFQAFSSIEGCSAPCTAGVLPLRFCW